MTSRLPRPTPYRRVIPAAALVAVNVILLAAYFWSRPGEEMRVRLEVRGNTFSAWVDDRLQAQAELPAAPAGGIAVVQQDTEHSVPSLPRARGLDSIRITDADTGRVLFEDRFDAGPDPAWRVSGKPVTDGGVLGTRDQGTLLLTDQPWRDYTVDAVFRNPTGAVIGVRAGDVDNMVAYQVTPLRDGDNQLVALKDGEMVAGVVGRHLRPDLSQSVRSMLAMALRPYPVLLAALIVAFLLALALHPVRAGVLRARLPAAPAWWPWTAAGTLAAGAFVITVYLAYGPGSHMPHVPDEVSYLFQAKVFASGRLHAAPPPVQDAFEFFYPPLIQVHHGRWASVYPFGHPLVLAAGELVHAPWLVPPLLGAASVMLLFALGRRLYSTRTGLLAAVLMASSPFFLMTASNYMSHNTAAFYLLGSLLFLAYADRRPFEFGVGGGLCLGLLFNTRPLTATVLAAPFGLLLLYRLWRRHAPGGLSNAAGFGLGVLAMLGAYFLYNGATTGHVLVNGYQASGTLGQSVGFGGQHTFLAGMENEQSQLAFLLLVLNGWPLYAGLGFLLVLPVVCGGRARDWFLLACAVLIMGAPVIFEGRGIMHGPRYWYEAFPLLMLLTARGLEVAAEAMARAAAATWAAVSRTSRTPNPGPVLAVGYVLVAALIGAALYGWLLGRHVSWHDDFVPARAVELKGFNGIDDRLTRRVEEYDLHHALVLVDDCAEWQCIGSVFWRNDADLKGDVVFARHLEERLPELLRIYAGRRIYIADYRQRTLRPYAGPLGPH